MQRRAFVPGAWVAAAVALAATLTACTSGSAVDGGTDDIRGGSSATTVGSGRPGKYRLLPEPCRLPDRNTLRDLLPYDGKGGTGSKGGKGGTEGPAGTGGPEDTEGPEARALNGQASITYDNDRRVGCRWKSETAKGTRHLKIDFERVVSYDPTVSDEDKAQQLYGRKELAADIPTASPSLGSSTSPSSSSPPGSSPSSSASSSSPGSTQDDRADANERDRTGEKDRTDRTPGKDDKDDKEQKGAASGSPSEGGRRTGSGTGPGSPAAPSSDVAPRLLNDLGDNAFLNDKLVTAGSGPHRDITIVFRSSNVIVTVEYNQWSNDKRDLPDSPELQRKAQTLAHELAGHFSE